MSGDAAPPGLWYTPSHEWAKPEGEELTVGVTDHAQAELTDIVFVDLPKPGKSVAANETVLVLESVKTVADIYAPVAGTVAAVNTELKAHPEWINQDPYGKGWIFRLKPNAPAQASSFLTAEAYLAQVAAG
jgi:glycine cleavage system H protein